MRPTYGALRLWSTRLITVGFLGVVSGVIGTIFAVMQAVTFAQGPATLLIGGTLAVLFVRRLVALSQCVKTTANIVQYAQEQQGRVE
jgi:hypothetical protein